MAEGNSKPQVRRRRSSGNPDLPLNLEVAFNVSECGTSQGTPSPCYPEMATADRRPSAALLEFRKKQQSFDIQIEDCDEEEIDLSDVEEMEEDQNKGDRPVTPAPPVQDFGDVVVCTEAPRPADYLKIGPIQNEGHTDISDADSDEE